MVAPVRFKTTDKNDHPPPAREITSRHRVDRRSLLPPWRAMPERENAIHPRDSRWTIGVARNNAPFSFHDAARPGIVVRHVADRMRHRRKSGERHPQFADGAGCHWIRITDRPTPSCGVRCVIVLAKKCFESVADSSPGSLQILGVILAILIAAGWYARSGLTSAQHQCHRDDVG
jgi:hypothetical protein